MKRNRPPKWYPSRDQIFSHPLLYNQLMTGVDLTPYNTFRVSVQAKNFRTVLDEKDVPRESCLVLGEGANLLFTSNVDNLVVKNEIKGRKILSDTDDYIVVELGAGENWHEFVVWSVENNLSGIENLALIPGTVGAAPVQNLAAYGQNVGEVIESVYGYSLDSKEWQKLYYDDCKLYYRDSIFKNDLKNKFFITRVTFKLFKTARFDTNYYGSKPYESLQVEIDKIAKPPYTPKIIAQAVINQRRIKMPDWKVLGTAGSFFKNPFVSKTKFNQLTKLVKDLQSYPVNRMLYPNPDDPIFQMADQVKIPAGRLLDELGWKGKRIGNVGTFEKHALVIVSYDGATGMEILDFSQKMQEDIKKHFDIELVPEVNII